MEYTMSRFFSRILSLTVVASVTGCRTESEWILADSPDRPIVKYSDAELFSEARSKNSKRSKISEWWNPELDFEAEMRKNPKLAAQFDAVRERVHAAAIEDLENRAENERIEHGMVKQDQPSED